MSTATARLLLSASTVLVVASVALLAMSLFFATTLQRDIAVIPGKTEQARAKNRAMEERFGLTDGLTAEQRRNSPTGARLYDLSDNMLDFGEQNFHLFYKLRVGLCLVGSTLLGLLALLVRFFSRRANRGANVTEAGRRYDRW